jgi:hypothetical protein
MKNSYSYLGYFYHMRTAITIRYDFYPEQTAQF